MILSELIINYPKNKIVNQWLSKTNFMELLTEILPYVGGSLSVVNVVILFHLKTLQKDLDKDAKRLEKVEEDLNKRIRRIEFFLDKRFSFSSLPDGYK